jgi:DNA-binding CsgD family transcriptional regulator
VAAFWHVEEPSDGNGHIALSARELEVLQMAAQGLTNAAVAHRLRLSVHGVKFHLSSVYRKLGVSNRTEAVARLLTAREPLDRGH